MNGAGRAGQVEYAIDLDVEGEGHIVSHQFEIGLRKEVRHIALRPGEVVVDAKYVGTLGDEAIAEVGAKKAGTTGDKNFGH
jgi:hypothetical protein